MFYGLQGMSGESREVLSLLATLNAVLASSAADGKRSLSYSEFARAVYGLQSMSLESAAVRRTLTHLTRRLRAYILSSSEGSRREDGLTGKDVAMTIYGLQSMGSDWPQVLQVLEAVSSAMQQAGGVLSLENSHIVTIFHSLQKMGETCFRSRITYIPLFPCFLFPLPTATATVV